MRAIAISILVSVGVLGLIGCTSGLGWYELVRDPRSTDANLRRVQLKGESAGPPPPGLVSKGSVSGSYFRSRGRYSSQLTCDSLIGEALAKLLRKAEKLGGNSIRELESRGSRHWSAQPVCQVRPGNYPFAEPIAKVSVRGVAVYDPEIEVLRAAALLAPEPPTRPKDIQFENLVAECHAADPKSRRQNRKRKQLCAELGECLSGYNMSLRPEDTQNELCADRLRKKHGSF